MNCQEQLALACCVVAKQEHHMLETRGLREHCRRNNSLWASHPCITRRRRLIPPVDVMIPCQNCLSESVSPTRKHLTSAPPCLINMLNSSKIVSIRFGTCYSRTPRIGRTKVDCTENGIPQTMRKRMSKSDHTRTVDTDQKNITRHQPCFTNILSVLLAARLANIFCPANVERNNVWVTESDRKYFTLGVKACFGATFILSNGQANFAQTYYGFVLRPDKNTHTTKIQVLPTTLVATNRNRFYCRFFLVSLLSVFTN